MAICGIRLVLRWRWGWVGIGLAVFLGVVAVSMWGEATITRWITTGDTFTSLESRLEVWGRAIYMIQDFPFGIGMGLYGSLADRLYPLFLSPVGKISHAHNLFLQLAVDLGIPGLLAWLTVFFTMMACAWRIYRSGRLAKDRWRAGLGAGLLCSQLALCLHGLVDAVTWGMVRSAPLVWVLWGAIMAFSLPQPVTVPHNQIAHRATRFSRPSFAVWLVLILLALPSAFTWLPQVLRTYQFTVPLLSIPGFSAVASPRQLNSCDAWVSAGQAASQFPDFTDNQRLLLGTLMVSSGCLDWAARVLPEFTAASGHADLLAYQWGRIAWARGDELEAVSLWRQGENLDKYLLLQASESLPEDIHAAMQWYEAAIMSASSPGRQAEAIAAYTQELRGRIDANEFAERLAYLVAYFGPETSIGHRLQAQRSFSYGNFAAASTEFSQAIASGFEDSETWYLLGEVVYRLGDLERAEYAYRQALDAPVQIPQRHPWYLYRL